MVKQMKISFIAPLLMTLGGTNRFLAEIATGLCKKGYVTRIHSLAFEPKKTFEDFQRLNVITSKKHLFSKPSAKLVKWSMTRFGRILSPPFLLIGILITPLLTIKAFVKDRPNLVFITGNHTLICIVSLLWKNHKFVCYYHGAPPTLWYKSPVIKLLRVFEKVTMLKSLVVANSSFTASELKRGFNIGKKIHVVYPGIDISRFECVRRCDDGKTLLNVGRINPSKRQVFLVELLPKLMKVEKDVKLVLVGSVDSKLYLTNCYRIIEKLGIKDRVEIIDFNDALLPKVLSKATVYLHPSVESFGISIVEAMAAGLPVIVYNQGGQIDVVSDSISGFVAGEDPEEWFGYIVELLTDRRLYGVMSKAAKSRARLFSLEKTVNELERVMLS